MRLGHLGTFFVVIPLLGPELWSIKVRTRQKVQFWKNTKWLPLAIQLVSEEKIRKQKSSV